MIVTRPGPAVRDREEDTDDLSGRPAPAMQHGRVLARDGHRVWLRLARRELEVVLAPSGSADETLPEPGDLVAITPEGAVSVLRALGHRDYPSPDSEVARLPRARLANLETRARVLAAVRRFFAERDFIEVETPLVVKAPSVELHVAAVPVSAAPWPRPGPGAPPPDDLHMRQAGQAQQAQHDGQKTGPSAGASFLITSPEFQMKRLLAAGMDRIYTMCKCFRADEEGPLHAGEFTMLEWYRGHAELDAILADTEELVAGAARSVHGATALAATPLRGPVDVAPPWPRMTVAEAMAELAGVPLVGDEEPDALAALLRRAGIDPGAATRWDDLFYTAFVHRVEPALARFSTPVVLVDWPIPLAALARRKPGRAPVVDRFEVYMAGIELANAFGELIDASEQRARFHADLAARAEIGLPCHPIDQRFLAALDEGLPPCAGIALGVDRLVMLLCGADHIRDVVTMTADEL